MALERRVIYERQVQKREQLPEKDGSLLAGFVDLGHFGLDLLSALVELGNSLETHLSSAPLAYYIVVVLGEHILLESSEFAGVFLVNGSECNDSAVLLVDQSSESALSLLEIEESHK
jgi:hypothetical protein